MPTAYDYHLYDQVWQRVAPDLNPYPEVRAAAGAGVPPAPMPPNPPSNAAPSNPMPPASTPTPRMEPPAPDTGVENLPGAEKNPCCMGTEAQDDLEVVTGFIEEELAERRCCMALAQNACRQDAQKLLYRIAREKRDAAKELSAAYYLITGTCYTPAISVEPMRWESLCGALRDCYHQEACNALNYQRAADGTGDLCLQKLLNRLGEQSYRRAEDVMALISKMVT